MLVSYNWLKEYLGDTAPTAQEAADLLGAHAFEIEEITEKDDDTIIDIDVLPNRSSDCLCHRGIAREVATLLAKPLAHDPLQGTPELPTTDLIKVEIADPKKCPRFTASLITGVAVQESPQWLKDRLEAIGQRSINNIVDATNYVMFAIGQPIHAYDAELFPQVDGKWQFGVRTAASGEVVSLLAEGGKDEDRDIELKGTELLIIDESSNTPIGLAGVKGGRFAGVHAETTKIIVEAAHFEPIQTRKTARGLGIVIDASKRFENEPSRELPIFAQAEIIKLITAIAGGESEGVIDSYLEPWQTTTVAVSVTRANALIGIDLTADACAALLQQAGIMVEVDGDTMHCTGPFERTDLMIEEDFIEEIGRIHGYDHVASVVPETVQLTELNVRHYYSELVRETLLGLGFSEVITSSFRKKDNVKLKNALASDKSFLRSALTKNIEETLDKNAGFTDLLGATDTRVFELGTVFEKGGELGVTEHVSLALGVRLKSSGYTGKEDKVLQAVLATLEETLDQKIDWTIGKGVAETNFTTVFTSAPVPAAYEPIAIAAEIAYQPFSTFPHMSRDIALWVDEGTAADDVMAVLNEHAGALRVRTDQFDEFTKDGRTSLAFRLVFQSSDRTLTDEEVNLVMDSIYEAVAKKDWEVR